MIDVCYTRTIELYEPELFELAMKLVTEERREKVLACNHKENQIRSLAAGLLFRYGLFRKGISAESFTICSGIHGKPRLCMANPTIAFNVSHASTFAVSAFSDAEVGVDVEDLRERFTEDEAEQGMKRMEKVMKRAYTEPEISWVNGIEPVSYKERRSRFTRIWTRKECYAKAFGDGIFMPFSEINTLDNDSIYSFEVESGVWISVCVKDSSQFKEETVRKISVKEISIQEVSVREMCNALEL